MECQNCEKKSLIGCKKCLSDEDLKDLDKKAMAKTISSYRMLLRHYYEVGVGGSSKFTGCRITDNLIDVIQNRFIELGGKMESL